MGVVGIILGVADRVRGTASIAWGRAGRSVVVGWVDWFGGFVPLGFLGVDVDEEPVLVRR